jgi:predicted  nucleic acid-binding Zn-ribbon protein
MAETIKLLTADNTPNSSFKLSCVSKDTIEVTNSFNSQLTKVTNAYSSVSSSLTAIQKQINSDSSKYKDYLDSKRLNALKSFASAVKKQAANCDARKKNMKEWANKDVTSIKEAAQKKAWLAAIEALLKENLSDSAKAALQSLKSIL